MFCDSDKLVTLWKLGEVRFRVLDTKDFHEKTLVLAGSYCRRNLKYKNFTWSLWQTTSQRCTKEGAARAARLFFFILPIKSLIFAVAVAVTVQRSPSVLMVTASVCGCLWLCVVLTDSSFLVVHRCQWADLATRTWSSDDGRGARNSQDSVLIWTYLGISLRSPLSC